MTDNVTSGIAVSAVWDTAAETADAAAGITLNSRVPVLLDVQVCLTYSTYGTQCTWSQQPVSVQRVPHAFGNGFPTAAAGPGQVALWTGELALDATDVSIPGYNGSLSISRTHATYAGTPSPASAVFGPGWTANLDGPDAGLAGAEMVDSTRLDGTLAVVNGDGTALVFQSPTGRRSTATLTTGTYTPADQDTIVDGTTLSVSGTGSAATVTVTELDGTVTVFTAATAATATTDALFAPTSVTEPAADSAKRATTRFAQSGGKVYYMVTAAPGVTCTVPTDPNATAAGTPLVSTKGCRGLRIVYATATTATATTPGDYAGQVKAVYADLWNPATNAMVETAVATYLYTNTGRLRSVTDPRTALASTYGYAANRVVQYTPPGQAMFSFTYASTSPTRLLAVSRVNTSGSGTTRLAGFAYDIPRTGEAMLPTISTVATALGQGRTPTFGAAVFGMDYQGTVPPAAGSQEWKRADLQYTDALGYTIDTASFGAGDWQYSATDFDTNGNVTRTLGEGATREVLTNGLTGSAIDQRAEVTVYNTATTTTPAGTLVTDTFGPAKYAVLPDGTTGYVRPRTHTDYDEGAPNSGTNPATGLPYRLPTTVTSTTVDAAANTITLAGIITYDTVSLTRNGYAAGTTGSADGWALGAPVTVTTDMGGQSANVVNTTVYDTEGAVLKTIQPSGSAAGTRTTTVYTTGGTGTCSGRPEWAGMTCQVSYGTPDAGPAIPATTTTYDMWLNPVTITETSGASSRTTTTVYDSAGRLSKSWTDASGLTGSTPVPGTRVVYSTTTGLPTDVIALDSAHNDITTKTSTSYDSWGRTVSYTPDRGGATTTAYDAAGRVASVTDPTGSTSYSYDADASGAPFERRGLTTSITTSNGTAPAVVSTAVFNAAGQPVSETLPGGLTRSMDYDQVGQLTALTYGGDVADVVANGDGTWTVTGYHQDSWVAWSRGYDGAGRVAQEWTPDAAAITGPAGVDQPSQIAPYDTGDALGYSRTYSYDRAGRLATVADRTATTTGVDVTTDPVGCQVRAYSFDVNGNRTALTRRAPATDGSCATTGGTTTSWVYDSADRLTSGYTYDAFGRATTIPGADTPNGSTAGALTLGYYDTEQVASMVQGASTSTYALDMAGRRATSTATPIAGPGAPVTTMSRYYSDTGDTRPGPPPAPTVARSRPPGTPRTSPGTSASPSPTAP
ncbi:MAG: DUF6531 domain-containing protein [Dermatophilaceae bacterium]